MRRELGDVNARDGERTAVVVVGHDPRMGFLLERLLGEWSSESLPRRARRQSAYVPGLAHTELIACYQRPGVGGYVARWALSPTDKVTEDTVRDKVRAKMDTAKVFAGVLVAVITFVANDVAALDGGYRTCGFLGLAVLSLAVVLYLVTMFWYDRLLMPTRFWTPDVPPDDASGTGVRAAIRLVRSTGSSGPRWSPEPFLRRPPSSSTWLLYQNMQLVWSRCFVPATVASGVGVVLNVLAVSHPRGWEQWVALAVGAAAFAIVAFGVAVRARPVLGVQD